jgi:hypothetical protein
MRKPVGTKIGRRRKGEGCRDSSHRIHVGHRCRMLLSQVYPRHGDHNVPNTSGDYWMAYHGLLPHLGPVALMISHQQSGQGTSESLHQDEKHISTKTRNSLGAKVKETLTEVKMSGMRKRVAETDKKKTYQRTERVTVLGLVCEKMTERVALTRQEEEDRRVRQEVCSITQDESVDDEDMTDADGFQDDREISEVTHVCEED